MHFGFSQLVQHKYSEQEIEIFREEGMILKKIIKLIGKWGLFMGISAIATWLLDMPTPIVPKDKEE